MERRSRRQFLQGGLALVGLGLASGCGLLPLSQQPAKVVRLGLFHVGLDHVPPIPGDPP
jgi:hypothetical protein